MLNLLLLTFLDLKNKQRQQWQPFVGDARWRPAGLWSGFAFKQIHFATNTNTLCCRYKYNNRYYVDVTPIQMCMYTLSYNTNIM